MFPSVSNYDSLSPESFEDYYHRFPRELSHIPKEVVETWIYRHWDDFQGWRELQPETWHFELHEFSCEEILKIGHVGDWSKQLHHWGRELINGERRRNTWLGRYMLESGTTPTSIIVGFNFGQHVHPIEFGDQKMKLPYQLIEGHMRLAYLFGMIKEGHSNLKEEHKVWVATPQ
ncbi:hypothetical protein [Vibrio rotiferianus]|uniref:hypothetical protein n=1 Tax=Vibrio rotiferianus TaxID=190895 RepID=UPI0038B37293